MTSRQRGTARHGYKPLAIHLDGEIEAPWGGMRPLDIFVPNIDNRNT